MLGLIRPDAGSISVLGMGIEHAWDIRRRLGYMPEHSSLPMGMTARDLVVHMGELRGLPRRVAVLRASEVLFQVGLEEERSRLIRTFSVGMRQRTNLAQAIVHSPGDGDPGRAHERPRPGRPRGDADARAAAVGRPRDRRDHVVARARGRRPHLRLGDRAARRAGGRHPAAGAGRPRRRTATCRCASSATPTRSPRPPRGWGWRCGADGDGWLLVRGADADAVLRGVRDAAIASGVGLHELRPGRPHARGVADRGDRMSSRRPPGRHRVHHATRGRAPDGWPRSGRSRAGARCARSAPAAGGRPS